jgi:hypothetical protein
MKNITKMGKLELEGIIVEIDGMSLAASEAVKALTGKCR